MANITFVKGKTGWIVIDCLTSKETAEEALKLVNQHCGKRSIKAVIFSHSHIDHYGGVLGIIQTAFMERLTTTQKRFISAIWAGITAILWI